MLTEVRKCHYTNGFLLQHMGIAAGVHTTLAMHTQASVHGKPMLVQEQLLWYADFLHPHVVAPVDWLVWVFRHEARCKQSFYHLPTITDW